MCGIAGAIGGCGPAVEMAVTRMQAQLVHRGPDGEGQWRALDEQACGVVLAHRRLAIIDQTERAHQPMRDPETGHVLTFNGEIYNFKSLRRTLKSQGAAFASDSDTEVILKAYAQWGIACVDRLQGMFAFGLWDANTGELHLVRDRLGVKPLYYAVLRHGDEWPTVLFASELRALLSSELIPRRLDPTATAMTVWHGFPIEPRTMVRGVRMLEAGHRTRVSPAGHLQTPTPYWPTPRSARNGQARPSDESEVTQTLTQSIESRLISDAPLGVFLSGGVDSTAVAAVAARASDAPLRTFSVTFDEAGFDESAYASEVAKAFATRHQTLRLTEGYFVDQLDEALSSLDQPSFDALNTYIISRAVREAGLTVALAGTGGDELFGGYRSFEDLPRARRWARATRFMPVPVRSRVAQMVTRLRTGRPGAIPAQTRWGKLADVLATNGDLAAIYQMDAALFTHDFFSRLLAADEPPPLTFGLTEAQFTERQRAIAGKSSLQAVAQLEQQTFLQQRLLRDTDAVSMASSLEVRVPLIDHTVVQSAAAMKDQDRFMPLGHKRLLRQLTEPEVPGWVFDRPKSGFVLPIERWLRKRLWRQVDETLRDGRLCRSVGLAPEAVRALWQAYQEKAPGLYWSRIWAIFTLLRWCQSHGVTLDGDEADVCTQSIGSGAL